MNKNTGCLGMIMNIFNPTIPAKKPSENLPYALRDNFLSPAELMFYKVLVLCLPFETTLLSKVRLSDIFYVKQPSENRGALNRIHMKHVDFIICRSDNMIPILAIELDDKSHNKKNRKDRDAFVDSVFSVAGLPILHIQAAGAYNPEELQTLIQTKLNQ